MSRNKFYILGAGFTGLSAGVNSGATIFEAKDHSGGICTSYYIDGFRFEIGGGHWIFGADGEIMNFFSSLNVEVKKYERKSAVYFPDWNLYVPYPIQNNLRYLPKEIKDKALKEIKNNLTKNLSLVSTLYDWLELNFGKTLCELFFFPFHELYTAGLYTKIAPQDNYKTPLDINLIMKGAEEDTEPVGYNITFVYPQKGLDEVIRRMEEKCKVMYNKKVAKIDLTKKEVMFEDGTSVKYERIISSLPLNKMVEMASIELEEEPAPYTSVLVINIGAKRGIKCPDYHWLYIPKSKTGFHRVGFYSNVEKSFLPISSRRNNDRVSIYVEKTYQGGEKLNDKDIKKLCDDVIRELKEWKFITEPEVVDPTWIETAYTWQYPNSNWRSKAIEVLKKHNIYQKGRYGKWKFQGIAESIKDGLIYGRVR